MQTLDERWGGVRNVGGRLAEFGGAEVGFVESDGQSWERERVRMVDGKT